jgi:hypothetical protein
MDALKKSPVEKPRLARGTDDLTGLALEESSLPPRIHAALSVLDEARDYARSLGMNPWEFAIEITTLRRLRLSASDLRWMIARGLVEHATELTHLRDCARSFRDSDRNVLSQRSCFVLTAEGAALIGSPSCAAPPSSGASSELAGEPKPQAKSAPPHGESSRGRTPKWDRDRQELRVGNIVVKRFTIPAFGPEVLLAAFEEQQWPKHIDDPLPLRDEAVRASRLQEAINALNCRQNRRLVRFVCDGNGQGVQWEFCGDRID